MCTDDQQTGGDGNAKDVVDARCKEVDVNTTNSLLGQQYRTDDINQVILSSTKDKSSEHLKINQVV